MEWTKYTTKTALKDNDELMILDKDANANKRTLMSKIWDYVVDKMTTAVIAKLGTTDKTLIGAVNELNSNARKHEFHTYYPCELAEPIIVNTFAFVEIKNIDWDEHCIVVSRYMGNNGIILVDYMSSENKNCNLLCTIQQVHQ